MSQRPTSIQALFAEMKRRRVFRVMAVYGVVAFGILQAADIALPRLGLPDWTVTFVLVLALLGFPIAIVLAWAFEQTPEGLKRTEDAAPGEIEAMVAEPMGRRWLSGLLALAGMVLLVGGAWWMGKRSGEGADLNLSVPAAQAADFRKIAVLPFENVNGDEENGLIAAGVHNDLNSQLQRISSLRVTAGTSVRTYADTNMSFEQIAGELDVEYLLEGSVQSAAGGVRVIVSLVDASTAEQLWTNSFNEDLTTTDLFDIQSNIARQVVDALEAELTPADLERFDAGPPTESLAALTWYQRAREAWMDSGRGGAKAQALDYAARAVELDPDFAEAWALLSRVRSWFTRSGEDFGEEALAAFERAEALVPGGIEALKARADYENHVRSDYPTALSLYRQAERLAPSDAEITASIGELQRALGEWPEAARTLKRAVSLDPKNTYVLNTLAMTLELLGRYAAADRVTERILQLDAADHLARARKVDLTFDMDGGPRRARSLAAELGLDPASLEEGLRLAFLAVFARDYDEAERVAALIPRDTLYLVEINRLWLRGAVRQLSGGDAAVFGDSLLSVEGDPERLGAGVRELVRAAGHMMAGRTAEGVDLLNEGVSLARSSDEAWMRPQVLAFAANTHAVFGQSEEALGLIDEVVEVPGYGVPSVADLTHDPAYDSIRDDPRFEALIERRRAFEAQAALDADADGPWLQ